LANVRNEERPLSPHLSAYKWGPHMSVSIIHRATGTGIALIGTLLFLWWLVALASGEATYGQFFGVFTTKMGALSWLGYVIAVPLTWAIFQHMGSGIRHLFLDQGANFELKSNKTTALLTFLFSVVATAGFWFVIWEKSNG
jgi:succinate dehydrogenase / fumarate reductase cytochrome b subunit